RAARSGNSFPGGHGIPCLVGLGPLARGARGWLSPSTATPALPDGAAGPARAGQFAVQPSLVEVVQQLLVACSDRLHRADGSHGPDDFLGTPSASLPGDPLGVGPAVPCSTRAAAGTGGPEHERRPPGRIPAAPGRAR